MQKKKKIQRGQISISKFSNLLPQDFEGWKIGGSPFPSQLEKINAMCMLKQK